MAEWWTDSMVVLLVSLAVFMYFYADIMLFRNQRHSENFKRYSDMMETMALEDDHDYLIYDESDDKAIYHIVTREVHRVHCDMGITIRVTEVTEMNPVEEPEWPDLLEFVRWKLRNLFGWLFPRYRGRDGP